MLKSSPSNRDLVRRAYLRSACRIFFALTPHKEYEVCFLTKFPDLWRFELEQARTEVECEISLSFGLSVYA